MKHTMKELDVDNSLLQSEIDIPGYSWTKIYLWLHKLREIASLPNAKQKNFKLAGSLFQQQ